MAKRMIGIASATALALTAVISNFSVTSALADDTGFASTHELRREGGRTCQVGHYHSGSGSGRTRKLAEIDAIKSWSSFTAFEYGTDWARFSKAASKRMSCSAGSSGYDCSLEARPCK